MVKREIGGGKEGKKGNRLRMWKDRCVTEVHSFHISRCE